jgi:hypothetical protein
MLDPARAQSWLELKRIVFITACCALCFIVLTPLLKALFAPSSSLPVMFSTLLSIILLPWLLSRWFPAKSVGSLCPEGQGLYPECLCCLQCTADALTISEPEKAQIQIKREQLRRVSIETSADGPYHCDLWWVLQTNDAEYRFPQGATGERTALDWLHQLPGFDDAAVLRALGSTDHARFLCWQNVE